MLLRTILVVLTTIALPAVAATAQTSSSLVVTTNPTTGQDVVHYVPLNLGQVDNGKDYIEANDPRSQYAQVVAYGRCVVARDRDRSIAFVRAAASGDPERGFTPLRRTSDTCRRTVAKDAVQLWRGDLRVSAIADALRAN